MKKKDPKVPVDRNPDLKVRKPSVDTDDLLSIENVISRLDKLFEPKQDPTHSINLDFTGAQLGKYEIVRVVGRGAFGIVYQAVDLELGRKVAIKLPRPESLVDTEKLLRFQAEAQTAAVLDHPSIVPVYEAKLDEPVPYIVSAFCSGLDLGRWLAYRSQPPPFDQTVSFIIKVCHAVQYVHEQQIIHRDLKPGNIMLESMHGEEATELDHCEPRLTDFGLAKLLEQGLIDTRTSLLIGTPSYMAPEQLISGANSQEPTSDIYAIGVVLFELLTLKTPFEGTTYIELFEKVRRMEPCNVREHNPAVPRDLETICLKCLQKSPNRRYQTAGELAADLNRWSNHEPILARRIGRFEKIWKWCRRKPVVSGSIAAAAIAMLLVSLVAKFQIDSIRSKTLVKSLAKADISQVDSIIEDLSHYRNWAEDDLELMFKDSTDDSNAKLHAALALVETDCVAKKYIASRILTVTPIQFRLVRDMFRPSANQFVEGYWQTAKNKSTDKQIRFRTTCVLASYDPASENWNDDQLRQLVASQLVRARPSELTVWLKSLRQVQGILIEPLSGIFRDKTLDKRVRAFATDCLVHYLSDDLQVNDDAAQLFDLCIDAEPFQFQHLFQQLCVHRRRAIEMSELEIGKLPTDKSTEDELEKIAMRKANAAVMLVRLGITDKVLPMIGKHPDTGVRSHIIHGMAPLQADPVQIKSLFVLEQDVSVKRSLLLCLGEFPLSHYSELDQKQFVSTLLQTYENDPGLHSSTEWLLQKWDDGQPNFGKQFVKIDKRLQVNDDKTDTTQNSDGLGWRINSQGQTLVIMNGQKFLMGSRKTDRYRLLDERPHFRVINRQFEISSKETTKAQWNEFQNDQSRVPAFDTNRYARSDDSPAVKISWYDAAAYCNWLSRKEGIDEDQWCYEPNSNGEYASGMKAKEDFLDLHGYRLPTESEWEFACRAGTETTFLHGQSETLINNYARFLNNSDDHTWPANHMMPNDFGMFGMLGNVWEWCHDPYGEYPNEDLGDTIDEFPGTVIDDKSRRVLRGGSFNSGVRMTRPAYRVFDYPVYRYNYNGFRVARTRN